MDTKKYYNENSKDFIERTVDLDMSFHYQRFEQFIEGEKLLDLGFGSGRDSLHFSKNYEVVSGDIIDEFLKYGKKTLNNEVRYVDALDMDIKEEFDAVWACASLLHISTSDLKIVFQNVHTALTKSGVLYCSFKYGTFEGNRNGRFFNDFDEEKFKGFYQKELFTILDLYISGDGRPGKNGEQWLNVILRRRDL